MQCKIKKKEFKHLSDPPESKVVKIVGGEEVEPIFANLGAKRARAGKQGKARARRGEGEQGKGEARARASKARQGRASQARVRASEGRESKKKVRSYNSPFWP